MAHRVDSHGFSKYHSLYASLSSPMLKNVSGKLLPGTLEDPTVIFNVRQLPSLFSQIVDIAMKLRESMLRHLAVSVDDCNDRSWFLPGIDTYRKQEIFPLLHRRSPFLLY